MLKRLVLALSDNPAAEGAIALAADLAASNGATITAVPFIDPMLYRAGDAGIVHPGEALRRAQQSPVDVTPSRVNAMTERLAAACQHVNFRIAPLVENPFDEVKELWRYHDGLVVGLHGAYDPSLVADSVDLIKDLIRRGIRPIFAAPATWRPVRRVLVAYSGSLESAKAMKRFVQMWPWPNADLHVACFGQPAATAKQLLADAIDYCRTYRCDATAHVVDGGAKSALLPFADSIGADAIVLGDSFGNLFERAFLGDTVSTVITHTKRVLFLSH